MSATQSKDIQTFPALATKTAQGKSKYAPEYREKIVSQLLDDNLGLSMAELAEIHNLNEGTLASWRTQYKRKHKKRSNDSMATDMSSVIQGLKEEIKNTDKLLKAIDKEVEEARRVITEADDKKDGILERKKELENLLETSKKLKL